MRLVVRYCPYVWDWLFDTALTCETGCSILPLRVRLVVRYCPYVWDWLFDTALTCETGCSILPLRVRLVVRYCPYVWDWLFDTALTCETGCSILPLRVILVVRYCPYPSLTSLMVSVNVKHHIYSLPLPTKVLLGKNEHLYGQTPSHVPPKTTNHRSLLDSCIETHPSQHRWQVRRFLFRYCIVPWGNSGRLTWVRHSSRKSSATHSYQCLLYLCVSKQWCGWVALPG